MADAIKTAFSAKERDSEAMAAFGLRLRAQFSQNEAYRRMKELEWIESLRQYKGIYDPDVKIEPNNSKVYPKITRSKVNIVLSRLHEMLFPDTEKNWEIEPTPEPRIARETVKQIAMSMVYTDQAGEAVIPTKEDLHLAIANYAKEACEKMSIQIDDQLTEMDYPGETKKVLRSGLMYGTGVAKGPLINKRTKRLWEPVEGTDDYAETVNEEDVPFFEFVRIWDWYPDMSVTEHDEGDGDFERHVMTKHELRQLIKRPDFYDDIIKEYLEQKPGGDYVPKNWEIDLQVLEVEASTGRITSVNASSTTDRRDMNRQLGRRYEVLEFWGYVDGQDLEVCGIDVKDVTLEYGANIWLLGNKVIKAALFDGALDKYKVFYYEKDETSVFGEGLARIMRHSAIAIGAGARMLLDNAACVSGPQVEVNWSLMTPDTDLNSFYPRKIWYREGKGVDAQYPAIRSLDFESHIPELLTVIDAFKQFGDEETTLPTWMIGQMVNNETAQATSGRMATITVSIKDVVKNFDSFTERIIRDLYAWNMEFNPRTDIKGDYKVKARGVSSLVMKEVRMQALNQLQSTMLPEDWVYVDRREFLAERFKAHDIRVRLRTEEEADKIREQQQQSEETQLALQMARAEIKYKEAQTMSQLTKAKKANIEATKDANTPPEIPAGDDPRMLDAELVKKQEEINKVKQDQQIKAEKHLADLDEMEEKREIERLKLQVEMLQKERQNRQDLDLKKKTVEHGMKLKEKVATIKARQKPKPAAKK